MKGWGTPDTKKQESRTTGADSASRGASKAKPATQERKESENPAPTQARGEQEGDAENGAEDSGSPPDELTDLVERLKGDLSEVTDAGDIDGLLEMFGDQVQMLREGWPDLAAELDEAADAARERLA